MPVERILMGLLLLVLLGGAVPGVGVEKSATEEQGSKKETSESKPENIDQAVVGYEKIAGWFTFYRKAAEGETKLLLELREEQVGVPFFMEATFATGAGAEVMNGEPVQNFVLEWQRTPDDRLLLTTPNLGFRAPAGSPLATAVARSFPEGYLDIFTIVTRQPNRKSLLIDVSDLFTGDFTGISGYFNKGDTDEDKSDTFTLDHDMSFIRAVKSFPENSVVETQFHFKRTLSAAMKKAEEENAANQRDPLADMRSLPVRVVYNLWPQPAPGYHPRLADSRVGYFVIGQISEGPAGYQSFAEGDKPDPNIYYINRWRLEKRDPVAPLSPPVKPIVFWIDKSVPEAYRQAVRDGILSWNHSFARLGLSDVIVVKDMPADADWDHADLRYNVIRWVATPWGSNGEASEGIFRENPLTGEILNGGIDINADLTRAVLQEEREEVQPGNAAPPAKHSAFDYQSAMREQGWYGLLALRTLEPAMSTAAESAYVQDMLRSVVAHEMGHILGLRHNFKGSTYLTPHELAQPGNMVSSSLMDYVPFNIYALHHPGVPFFNIAPGAYDQWAIAYGYTLLKAGTPEEEVPALRAIAARNNEPGLRYGTDEEADNYDPAIQRFDLSNDPLAYCEASFALNNTLLRTLGTRLPAPGESYRQFTLNFLKLLHMQQQVAAQATIYLGSLRIEHNHRGDPQQLPPLSPLPAAEQYRALRQLTHYIFSEAALTIPRAYFTKLSGNPYATSDTLAENGFPIRQTLGDLQKSVLQRVFDNKRLTRIAENEFTAPADAFRMADLFTEVSTAIWAPLEKKTPIAPLQRDLQHTHLLQMIDLAASTQVPPDARMFAWQTLRDLRARIAAALPAYTERYARAHLAESLSLIDHALARKK